MFKVDDVLRLIDCILHQWPLARIGVPASGRLFKVTEAVESIGIDESYVSSIWVHRPGASNHEPIWAEERQFTSKRGQGPGSTHMVIVVVALQIDEASSSSRAAIT